MIATPTNLRNARRNAAELAALAARYTPAERSSDAYGRIAARLAEAQAIVRELEGSPNA